MTELNLSARAPARDSDDPDATSAAAIATSAGRLLLELRAAGATDCDPDALRRSGDRSSHDRIVALIGEHFPDDAILSEEGADDPSRLSAHRVWIVDPLDGTREYGEPGRSDWAVHVALVVDGELVAGAVALPALGCTYSTVDRPALAGRAANAAPRILVSRTRRPADVLRVADALGGTLIEMGSAGAKAMAVVCGDADVYAHSGGQFEWDSAAPVAVARAAGLHVSRIDGSELRYNQPDPHLPDLLICRPELAARTLEVLAR
ncbi:3'(2'),5'-bisphosphate nucleotidase CysQ [Nocardiaceae bacterium NPDC056970]